MCKTFYLMGTTCVGKDYFTDLAIKKYPNLFGSVNVGKEFRRRYPPEFFEGKGALEKTEDEAFEIFKDQWNQAKFLGAKYILVSGQPRLVSQVDRIVGYAPGTIILLWAPDQVLKQRLQARFAHLPSSFELSFQRLTNDRVQLYDVIFECIDRDISIRTVNTQTRSVEEVIDQIAHFGQFLW